MFEIFQKKLADPAQEEERQKHLAEIRAQTLLTSGLTEKSLQDYESLKRHSRLTPEWKCGYCATKNKCAQSTCSGCEHERPRILHGLLELDGFEGLARRVADKKIRRLSDVLDEAYSEVKKWDLENEGYEVSKYRFFDSNHPGIGELSWMHYLEYILKEN